MTNFRSDGMHGIRSSGTKIELTLRGLVAVTMPLAHARGSVLKAELSFGGLVAALCLTACIGAEAPPQPALGQELNSFACDLYGQLKERPGNVFFSPYSISGCLAMTYAGARGETEKQMAQVLHFDLEQKRLHLAFHELQGQLNDAQKTSGIELSVANALWAQQGHPFLPAFLNVARDDYMAEVKQADFKAAAEAVRTEINRWVEHKTKDRIQNIVPPGVINPMTRLVLANAIYFKGAWTSAFSTNATRPQPFHLSGSRETRVPMMYDIKSVNYFEDTNVQAVELPYIGNQLSMVVLLPREIEGCAELEAQLTAASISGWLQRMKAQRVELFVPRFKMELEVGLSETLQRMGMRDAFTRQADFSGMDGHRDLFISAVLHKAWVEVNEKGTEAAAATVVVARPMAAIRESPPPPPVFRADHPFIFFIRDVRSGRILFLGRLSSPAPSM